MYVNVFLENLKVGSKAKVILITGRIHPGESPSSYVCEGMIIIALYKCA